VVPRRSVPFVTTTGERYYLEKFSPQGASVSIGMNDDCSGWSWEVAAEIHKLAEVAITEKAHKLRNVPRPWVLLLLDLDHAATKREYEEVRRQLVGPGGIAPTLHQFHAVYVINGGREVFRMYPDTDPAWATQP
jgi:hypothetical protein